MMMAVRLDETGNQHVVLEGVGQVRMRPSPQHPPANRRRGYALRTAMCVPSGCWDSS